MLFNRGNYCLCSKMIGDVPLTGKAVIFPDASTKLGNFRHYEPYRNHLIGETILDEIKTVAVLSVKDMFSKFLP